MTKYTANPITVDAIKIVDAMPEVDQDGNLQLLLETNHNYHASPEQCARMTPVPGDYLVRTSDGYEYLNPKHVFEAKYAKVADDAA